MSLIKSPYQKLKEQWQNCTKCPLHQFRHKFVLSRGRIPCDVCFVGEAPGQVDNLVGAPFKGDVGDELDRWIDIAETNVDYVVPYKGFMNLVSCFPNDPARKHPEPKAKEIDACYPRLEALLTMCKPKLIVAVGKLAEKQSIKQNWSDKIAKTIHIIHPSAVLREPMKNDLEFQRAILMLEEAFHELGVTV